MKKVMFLCLAMAMVSAGISQANNSESVSENNRYNFGFFFGVSQSDLTYDSPSKPIPNGSLPKIINSPGLDMGLTGEWKTTDHLSFRLSSGVSINGGYISYNVEQDGQPLYERNEAFLPVTLNAGLHGLVNLKSEGTSPFLVLGATSRLSLIEPSAQSNLTAENGFISADIGIGLNTALKHFKLCPEFRYSYALQGMDHALLGDQTYMHQLSLIIGFKG